MYKRQPILLPPNQDVLYRIAEVEAITGLKRATIYQNVRAGRFPAQVQLSSQSVAWRKSDLDAWMAALQISDNKSPAIPFEKRKRRA